MEELRDQLHELIEKYGVAAYEKIIKIDKKLHDEIILKMK